MSFLFVLLLLSMVAALAALGLGLFSMLKGGEFNRKYGNKLMVWRVAAQGIAVGALFLMFLLGA
ncbi:MAG: twin transmembrane helix small protein [Alphaproteobacteria bacterium]|nr:twin transmembrane helix small protein [Alphaproteobacteria bacterium]